MLPRKRHRKEFILKPERNFSIMIESQRNYEETFAKVTFFLNITKHVGYTYWSVHQHLHAERLCVDGSDTKLSQNHSSIVPSDEGLGWMNGKLQYKCMVGLASKISIVIKIVAVFMEFSSCMYPKILSTPKNKGSHHAYLK